MEHEPGRVRCNGCRNWIICNPKRNYDLKNWRNHLPKCPGLTQKKTVRVRAQAPLLSLQVGTSKLRMPVHALTMDID